MVSPALNINSFGSQNNTAFDFRTLSFYIKNLWIVKVFDTLHLSYLLRLQVAAVNKKLEKKLSELISFIVFVNSYQGKADREFSVLIEFFSKEAEKLGYAHNELQRMFEYKNYKNLGDWDTTNKLLIQVIEADYKLVRALKKFNKKASIPTSQLAKDTVNHSRSALSKIINGH